MNGTDLKLTPEIATHQLGRDVEGAIERIRAIGEDLAKELSVASTAVKPIDIAKAEVAAVIDFAQPYENGENYRPQMQLNFSGSGGGSVQLHSGIRKGRYRALILIDRL